ncbi:MAG TPA: TetR/AcrR family transcriptional regulator [Burkholderiaceae bacterium]|nr:TetR/AcrR family transcriptional regulator [Burkholderiaceae bacterium]
MRGRILAAAFAAFKELGYSQASTLEIATRAKVSKRELYALFGSKQQMLVTCISERAQRMRLPDNWPPLKVRGDLDTALAAFGEVLLREISDPDVIMVYRFAIAEAERSIEVAQALDTHGRKAACAALRAMLEQAQAGGLLDDTDPGRMVGQFMSLLLGDVVMSLAMGLAKRPGPSEIRQRAREATNAFLQLHPGRAPGAAAARAAGLRPGGV